MRTSKRSRRRASPLTSEILSILTAAAAVFAPILVYLGTRTRAQLDRGRGHASDDAATWERMTRLLDRYTKRTEDLEFRVRAAEKKSSDLGTQINRVRGALRRWRAYAMALSRQLEKAGVAAVSPVDFGIGPDDDEHEDI